MTDQQIIDEIEKVRSKNNINWMNILRLAFKYSPVEARKIVSKINEDDGRISKLLKNYLKIKMTSFSFKGIDSVLIVAELSANHNGSLATAKETIKAAKRAGADAIKLQTYTSETITLNCNSEDFIIKNKSIWDGMKYSELYQKAHSLGLA